MTLDRLLKIIQEECPDLETALEKDELIIKTKEENAAE